MRIGQLFFVLSKLVSNIHASHVSPVPSCWPALPFIPNRPLCYLRMGDERCADHEYAEDVDAMILEYLIYNATKACIDDFSSRNVGENALQASHNVLTQLHVLNGKTDSM